MFDGELATKFEGNSHRYQYICGYCSVRWNAVSIESSCWCCGRTQHISKSLEHIKEELARDYQVTPDEVRIIHTDDEEERPR